MVRWRRYTFDDCRTPRANHWFDWRIVRSYDEFVANILANGVPNMVSFDHDLADEHIRHYFNSGGHDSPPSYTEGDYAAFTEKTGMDCAKWLVNYCLDHDIALPHFTVHSANPAGAENILSLLNGLQRAQGQEPNGYRTAW